MGTSLLEIRGVQKSFGGIFALRGVDLKIQPGEQIAIVGENGAGKSTLMKILSGVWPHGSFEGELYFNGLPYRAQSPVDARKAGISIIHQELCLFSKLTAAENIFITENFPYDGKPSEQLFSRVRWDSLFEKAEALMKELGFRIPVREKVENLSVAERQLVEIAKAFHQKATLLILDEPSSALSQDEVRSLYQIMKRMKGKMTFIYISHKLDEVFEVADRIVVLRDGKTVASLDPKKSTHSEVIHHMVGRPLRETSKKIKIQKKSPILKVREMTHISPFGKKLLDRISFEVNEGEVLGIAGLMGAGRSELLRCLLGVLPGVRTGFICFRGQEVCWSSIEEAMEAGVAFLPEDRKKDGLFLDHGIDFNITISMLGDIQNTWGSLDLIKEGQIVSRLSKLMNVKYVDHKDPVKILSGGNQQKVLFAKVVARNPRLLMLDEPTRGIDVGAKEEIYSIIRNLTSKGISILLVSSELPEILALSDRVLVLREGKKTSELINENLTQQQVMTYAAGASYGVG